MVAPGFDAVQFKVMSTGYTAEQLHQMGSLFTKVVPHNQALGLEFVELSPERAILDLPYREDLVGNPETGVIHGGAITTLIDAACGTAVLGKLQKRVQRVATLDLRIDYLKPATPKRTVRAEATCFRVTRHVAFVRASAYHDADDPVASAAGTFVIFLLPEGAAQ